jgi:glucose/arabinose dehydrogenase
MEKDRMPKGQIAARRVRRCAAPVVALALLVAGCGGSAVMKAGAGTALVSIGAGLEGHDGLVATKYATGLKHVSALAFDGDGNLWAATAAYEDGGKDGVYEITSSGATPVLVISGISTPMGLVWHDGALYVSSAAGVDVYRNFNGTMFLDHRSVLAVPDGTGLVGELAFGSDGRFVVGISSPCDSCSPKSSWSAAVLSFLPDGSDVRIVASHIRAPVGLTYDASGTLYATVNQRDDLGAETPADWLAIVEDGQNWGFPDCYGQGGTKCDGVPEPVAELDQHAAASGVAVVDGQLGPTTGKVALVAEWARGVVLSVDLDTASSSDTSRFLTGFKSPVPVIAGNDDAVYVGDWTSGIVYRIASA